MSDPTSSLMRVLEAELLTQVSSRHTGSQKRRYSSTHTKSPELEPTPPTSPTCYHPVHTPGTPMPVVQGALTSLISGILLAHNPSISRQNSIPVPPQNPKCSKSQTNSPSTLLALLEQDTPQEMQEKCIPAIPFPLPTRSGWMQASSPPPVKRSKLTLTSSSKSPSSSKDSIGSQDIPQQARAYHWVITLICVLLNLRT